MLSDQGKRLQPRKRFAEAAARPLTKEKDCVSGAAAAYDTQEKDLITKPRKSSRQAKGRYVTLKQF
jgi:hypothetical protein